MIRRALRALQRWRREGWLRRGYCPLCYSSPPWVDCPVCEGSPWYGHVTTPARRRAWRIRWDRLNDGERS